MSGLKVSGGVGDCGSDFERIGKRGVDRIARR